jgi:hypothetical protein
MPPQPSSPDPLPPGPSAPPPETQAPAPPAETQPPASPHGRTETPNVGPEATREALALSLSTGLPYTGLREFTPDPKLFRYVPLGLAADQQIVPIVLVGDTLKLASASPHPDLSLLHSRFPYLTVDIVLAPGSEIDRVLQRVQGAT